MKIKGEIEDLKFKNVKKKRKKQTNKKEWS